jgi:methylenetetrahydrofolate reductase (NADPH)
MSAIRADMARPTAEDPSLVACLRRPRYEILPLEGIEEAVVRHIPREVKVTITASPRRGLEPSLELAERLRRRDYQVVPHLSARLIRDRGQLENLLTRLEAADVREVFVIAGDPREPAGVFASAAGLLSAMGELRGRFAEIGISGYPESHHLISDETTIQAMFEKEPMATYIVSQICFDTDVIAAWVGRVRDRGTRLPIWIGIPGMIDNRRLLRISLKIGLGESARFLRGHRGWLARLTRPRGYAPTRLLQRLAPTIADPAARIGGLHVYTFNELERTESWRRQLIERLTREND